MKHAGSEGPARRTSAESRGGSEARIRTIVVGVVEAVLEARAARGVVLTGPESPERRLLLRWLGEHAAVPDEETVERVRDGLAGVRPDAPPVVVDEEARRAVAHTVAAAEDFVCASVIHKTALVLGSELPPEPLLPLGDVWASEVAAVAGGCTLPAALAGVGPATLVSVDRALRAHLEEGRDREDALAPLELALRERLTELLARRRWGRFRTPVVPKLGLRTVGIDLE